MIDIFKFLSYPTTEVVILIILCVFAFLGIIVSTLVVIAYLKYKKSEEARLKYTGKRESNKVINIFAKNRDKQNSDASSENKQEQNIVAEDDLDSDDEIVEELNSDGKPVYVVYRKSMSAKLCTASDQVKHYYVTLANYILNYKNIVETTTFGSSTFRFAGEKVAKIIIKDKQLYILFPLDPKECSQTIFSVEDASNIEKYKTIPLKLKITNEKDIRFAFELFEQVVEKHFLEKCEEEKETLKVEDYPYQNKAQLIASNLINIVVIEKPNME